MCQRAVGFRRTLLCPLRDIGNPSNRRIHFSRGIERTNREPHATISFNGSKLRVHQRRAMQSSAGRNVMVHVEHDSHITGINALQVHEDR